MSEGEKPGEKRIYPILPKEILDAEHKVIIDAVRKKFLTIPDLEEAKKEFDQKKCCGKSCLDCIYLIQDCIDEVLTEKRGAENS